DERDDRGEHGAEEERRDVPPHAPALHEADLGEVLARGDEGRPGPVEQEDRDGGEDDEDDDPGTGGDAGEDPVAELAGSSAGADDRRWAGRGGGGCGGCHEASGGVRTGV